jgi:hypothetical protein
LRPGSSASHRPVKFFGLLLARDEKNTFYKSLIQSEERSKTGLFLSYHYLPLTRGGGIVIAGL